MNTKRDNSLFVPNDDELTPGWLQGFVDAEGCFYFIVSANKTSKIGYKVNIFFSITQHSRDESVLVKIKHFLKCGNIIQNNNNLLEYKVAGIKDISTNIIPFFQDYPLLSKKLQDFKYFQEVVEICVRKEHLTEAGLERVSSLKTKLNKRGN